MHRLFVALRPPPPSATACLDAMEDGPPGWAGRTTSSFTCTLRFVGEVERPRGRGSRDARWTRCVRRPVEVRLAGVGWFDHGRRGALFARGRPRPSRWPRFTRRSTAHWSGVGLRPERPRLPSRTSRWRGGVAVRSIRSGWLERRAGTCATEPRPVESIILYESHLVATDPTYDGRRRLSAEG